MDHRKLTLLILYTNKLIDSGKYDDISIKEITDHIDSGDVIRWLKERAADWDASAFLVGDFEAVYIKHLQSILDAYGDGGRKWGIRRLGLCLLLAWTNEIIQQGTGWIPNENIASRSSLS